MSERRFRFRVIRPRRGPTDRYYEVWVAGVPLGRVTGGVPHQPPYSWQCFDCFAHGGTYRLRASSAEALLRHFDSCHPGLG